MPVAVQEARNSSSNTELIDLLAMVPIYFSDG
jgi:hypothetical protein